MIAGALAAKPQRRRELNVLVLWLIFLMVCLQWQHPWLISAISNYKFMTHHNLVLFSAGLIAEIEYNTCINQI